MMKMNNTDELTQTMLQHIEKKLRPYSHIMVAYSGGVDSTVLLHLLVQLRELKRPDLTLRAIYIHHGISKNADQWAAHCQMIGQQWQVPVTVSRVQLAQQGNIEAQARDARYQAILHAMQTNEILCTAQHLDDQSETFLLALKRGSGPTGLSAMAAQSRLGQVPLIRPLLDISRAEIEQYAAAHQLVWIEDESNQDDHYDRNFLRLNILPLLNQRWPHFNQMVARSAELCAEQQALLDELLHAELQQAQDEQGALSIRAIAEYSSAKRNALLRSWFKNHHCVMPSRQQLDVLWQTVALAKEDAEPQLVLGQRQVRRYQQRLYLLPLMPSLQGQVLTWDLQHKRLLPDQLGLLVAQVNGDVGNLRLPTEHEQVTVRFSAQGRIKTINRCGSRPIKKLWQELNIPPWMRQRIPLVYYNEQLITAVGIFITEEGQGQQLHIEQLK